jgi:hypothetical protein
MTSCETVSDLMFFVNSSRNSITTENITDYNDKRYPISHLDVFLKKLPDESEPISYYYKKYVNDSLEICLELKFKSIEDIDYYINEIKTKVLNEHTDDPIVMQNGWSITETNPYNKNYTDIFLTIGPQKSYQPTSPAIIGYNYYITEIFENESSYAIPYHYSGNFQLISFSYDELRVVQFYSFMDEFYTVEDYKNGVCDLPQYFIRFNVPIDLESSRKFILNYGY